MFPLVEELHSNVFAADGMTKKVCDLLMYKTNQRYLIRVAISNSNTWRGPERLRTAFRGSLEPICIRKGNVTPMTLSDGESHFQ